MLPEANSETPGCSGDRRENLNQQIVDKRPHIKRADTVYIAEELKTNCKVAVIPSRPFGYDQV